MFDVSITMLRLQLSVCVCEREVTGNNSTRTKKFSLLVSLNLGTWDFTADSPLTRLAVAQAATEVNRFKSTAEQK
jgi:hypothetical protein